MSAQVTVLNAQRSEFDMALKNLVIDTNYNIVIHCVYDLFNDYKSELDFIKNPNLVDKNTMVVLWNPVEQGVFDSTWMIYLDNLIEAVGCKLVYLTACSHNININSYIPHKFNIKFYPIFDIRSCFTWRANTNNQLHIPFDSNRKNKYMFINLKDLAHRRFIFGSLIRNKLINEGIVSYRCHGTKQDTSLEFHIGRNFAQEQLDYITETFLLAETSMPLKIDDGHFSGALPRELFKSVYVGIVAETQFCNNPHSFNATFLTEKTFNAIANQQMFFIVGQAHSLEQLKFMGYKTFGDVIDESYDSILHNGNRLMAVNQEILRFISRPINEIQQDYIRMQEVIEHNSNLLFSQVNTFNSRFQHLVNEITQ